MSSSVVLKQHGSYLSSLPVGSIIAWHRDLLKDAAHLPPGWTSCDGQKLDDPESILHGQTVPDLNGEGRFLRGGKESGIDQADQMQSHSHDDPGHTHSDEGHYHLAATHSGSGPGQYEVGDRYPSAYDYGEAAPPTMSSSANIQPSETNLGNPAETDAGPPRHGAETRPINMSVIWIMKVRQTSVAQALPAVTADPAAPQGAVYVDKQGNVGVGTSKPDARLHVNGPLLAEGISGLTFITESPPDFSDFNIFASRGWIPTPHTISLDSAGVWLVLYTVRAFRRYGERGDCTELRFTTQTGGETRERTFPGTHSGNLNLTIGTTSMTHVFAVTGPDTVTVEVKDAWNTAAVTVHMSGAHFTAIRLK